MIEKEIAGSGIALFGGLQNFGFSCCLKMMLNGGEYFLKDWFPVFTGNPGFRLPPE
jgi:hypothetical protein